MVERVIGSEGEETVECCRRCCVPELSEELRYSDSLEEGSEEEAVEVSISIGKQCKGAVIRLFWDE